MAMKEIKKLDVLNFAVVMGLVSAVIGFVVSLLFLIGAGGMFSMMQGSLITYLMPGTLMIVVLPVIAFIYSFILGAVFAIAYNFIARKYQGFRIELE